MKPETPLARLYTCPMPADHAAWLGRAQPVLDPKVKWHVAHPINNLVGVEAVVDDWLLPLQHALPDLERRPLIALSDGGQWIAGTGFFLGSFTRDLYGIPATGRALYLRYTELVRVVDDVVTESYLIPDFLDAMWQAGAYPLRAGLGHAGIVPGPASQDGLWPDAISEARSAGSEQLVMAMLDCLRKYDGASLQSMDLENFWHPYFMWYGPGGIGTTRGIAGFRTHHQGPFLAAFPDRDVDHHACTVACGNYVATGGWPHMHGTHSSGGWLGLPATGKHLELRVMDIWRREGDLLCENWVAIDICHMLDQMGLDVFAQSHALSGGTLHG